MKHMFNGHMAASIDFETTGTDPDYHEIVQIAVVPLDELFQPLQGVRPFYQNIRPEHPERFDPQAKKTNRLSMEELAMSPPKERVIDQLHAWWDSLDLPLGRGLMPLAHNAYFELRFGAKLLGQSDYDRMFHFHSMCSMQQAIAINQKCFRRGQPRMFEKLSLINVAEKLDVSNPCPHDSLNDALVCAALYPKLLDIDVL